MPGERLGEGVSLFENAMRGLLTWTLTGEACRVCSCLVCD